MNYVDTIYRSLQTYGCQQRHKSLWICCPFHGEKTPSLSVAMTSDKVMVGSFHCFGCDQNGNWNTLADKIGAERIDLKLVHAEIDSTVKRIKRPDRSDVTTVGLLDTLGFTSHTKWPAPDKTRIAFFKEWYSIPGKLLYDLEAYLVVEQKKNNDESNQHRMFLPVKVHGVVRGGIRVVYEKDGIKRTYLNTDGDWVKSYGLFPYDHVHKMIKSVGIPFIILVEGPRDALRLINVGLPAIAILGSQSFDKRKALIIAGTIAIDTVYIMPDSDAAGSKMINLVARHLREMVEVKVIRLPTELVDGEVQHQDPHSVSEKYINSVKRRLFKLHKVT